MGKVKPSRVVAPRIVQPGGRTRPWLSIVFLGALGLWSWQVFKFGQQHAGLDTVWREDTELRLQARLEQIEEERDALRASAARFERASQIDRAAASGVKAEVKALQVERANLKREVAFLKSLVSGEESPLVIDDQHLSRIADRRFLFEATVSKRSDEEGTVSGRVMISVSGHSGDLIRTLDMKSLTAGKRNSIGIKFNNFQKLKAEIELPEGFEPMAIEISVEPKGKGYKSFAQSYEWEITDV